MSRDREPRPPHRLLRLWAWIVGCFLVFLVLAMGAVAFYNSESGPVSCDDFEFDDGNWNSGPRTDDEAADLVRCKTLKGMDRAEVLELIGSDLLVNSDQPWKKEWTYRAGEVKTYSGTEPQRLYVTFGDKGVVNRATLAFPEAD